MRKYLALLLWFMPALVFAQGGVGTSGIVLLNPTGRPMAGATVTVCLLSDNGVPCTQTVNIFSDSALSVPLSNPTTTDGLGNLVFYAAAGSYHFTVTGAGATITGQPYTAVVTSSAAANAATPNNAVQFNNGGTAFGGDSNFLYNSTTHTLSIPNIASTGSIASPKINNLVVVDGVHYTTLNAALADPQCTTTSPLNLGCTIDMRGNSSSTALALGAVDPGTHPVTLLLGPYTYSASSITLESNFKISGSGTNTATVIQSSSNTAPLFVIPTTTAGFVFDAEIKGLRLYCGAANSSQVGIDIVAPINGGGLWYSNFEDIFVGGDGTHECGGAGILLDGNAGGSPPAVNQFLTFKRVQSFKKNGGGPALKITGLNGQIHFDQGQLDGQNPRDTTPNVVINDGTQTVVAPYTIAFTGTTIQTGGIGFQLNGVTNWVCDGCHFENLSGGVQMAFGNHFGNVSNSVRNSLFETNTGINSGAGYITSTDVNSILSFDWNTVYGTPDNFFLGTTTYLSHTPLSNLSTGALDVTPWGRYRFIGGFDCDSPGYKCTLLTTGSIAATTRVGIAVNWVTPFVDNGAIVVCNVDDLTTVGTTQGLLYEGLRGVPTASGVVAIVFNPSGGALTGNLHCTAVHP